MKELGLRNILERIRIVLVETKYSGNIGLVARVMKNFGVKDLWLVNPRAELNKEAYARAVAGREILDDARICQDLPEALKGCQLVIGTTRRHGVKKKNIIGPKNMSLLLRSVLPENQVALVFGSEDIGLSNQHLKFCQWIVGIHPGTEYESFSLSHCVAIILYEIFSHLEHRVERSKKLADTEELEGLYGHLQQVLTEIGFIEPGDPRRMMLSFRAIFNRAGLTSREVNIIRGMLRQILWKLKNKN